MYKTLKEKRLKELMTQLKNALGIRTKSSQQE